MALSFLTGLSQGANRSMERRINRLDQQRLQAINDRRYDEALARQDAAFSHQQNMDAQRLSQWDRSFGENVRQFDVGQQLRQDAFDEGVRQFGVNQGFRESEAARDQQNRDTLHRFRVNQANVAEKQWYDEFDRGGRQFDTLQKWREDQANQAQQNWQAGFDRADTWRDEDQGYRTKRDAVDDAYRTNYFNFQESQARLANAARDRAAKLAEDEFEHKKWYQGEQIKYMNARTRKGSGPGSLDTNTVEAVENLADSFAKTFNETGQMWWIIPDKRVNPVEQMRHMEAQGAKIMTLLMNRFPGDPTTALQYLPSFWGRLLTAGEKGEYGDKVRKGIHEWKKDNPDRIEQEAAMFKALQYGALKEVGLAPEFGPDPYSGMEWEHLPDQVPSVMQDVGSLLMGGAGLGVVGPVPVAAMSAAVAPWVRASRSFFRGD